jgi:hypothetical protein
MKLKNILLSALLLTSASVADDMAVKQEGIKYIKMLGGALKSQLQAKMKEDKSGLTALAFCTSSADKITKEVNEKLPEYATVRRTSFKVRNNKVNAADDSDTKAMEKFEAEIKAKTLTPKTILMVEEGDVTRVYKPLVTKAVCLKCHGTNMDPKIVDAIKSSYPHDKAIDFKEGDLRGVIVAEIKKH